MTATSPVIAPAFASAIPEDVANRIKARRHLASLSPERRAQLEQEWAEAEFHREPISADIREHARIEWEQSK